MLKALHFARTLVAEVLAPGGLAIDATAGNGHDTEFLARLAGTDGTVYAFDIQQQAIDSTRERLLATGLASSVHLVCDGHEHMAAHIAPAHHGCINVVMFNLGYLPRGDKTITTQRATSLEAVRTALDLLAPNGLLTIMLYPGHAEGAREAAHLTTWAEALPQTAYQVLAYRFINLRNAPPWLLAIQKNPVLHTDDTRLVPSQATGSNA